jgi:HEAT repeat protein
MAVLTRMGTTALVPLVGRLGDASLDVRYYVTLALGELKNAAVVAPLGTRLYDPDAGVRRVASEALAQFPASPELTALVERLRAELPGPEAMRQRYAAEMLGVLRDIPAVPRLIELVKHEDTAVAEHARRALVEITKQDFSTSRWRWRNWWDHHRNENRLEWMLAGLAHGEANVRRSAAQELKALSQNSFGYAFDSPKREREEARRKWIEWFRTHSSSR